MGVKIVEFFTESGKVILVVVQELRLLGLEQALFYQVFDAGIEHERVGFDTEIASGAQEIDHPVSPAKRTATDVQQLVPGIEAVPDQRFELRPARFFKPLDATTNLCCDFVQAFAALLQGCSRIDGTHFKKAP